MTAAVQIQKLESKQSRSVVNRRWKVALRKGDLNMSQGEIAAFALTQEFGDNKRHVMYQKIKILFY